MKIYAWVLSGLLLLSGCLMFGQTATTQITGLVTDSSGATVPGAAVTVTNADTNATRKTQTNSEGYYTVPFLPAGKYSVSVERQGFKTASQTGLTLDVERVARIDFKT